MDMFGRDSDTTSDGEDDEYINIGAHDVQPATEAVESHPPLLAVGRALFARAVSDDTGDDDTDTGDTPEGGGRETKGEDQALINLCAYGGSGDVDEARDLIARGIDIDEQDEYGYTALLYAVSFNRPETSTAIPSDHSVPSTTVQELIRAGAALDLQNNKGITALIEAANKNNLEMVQELIRAGATLDMQDKQGRTALQLAQKWGYTKISTLLREATQGRNKEGKGRKGKKVKGIPVAPTNALEDDGGSARSGSVGASPGSSKVAFAVRLSFNRRFCSRSSVTLMSGSIPPDRGKKLTKAAKPCAAVPL